MSVARFPVVAHLDGAGGKKKGTVEIDRDTNMLSVRPYRSHRTYDMPLEMVATMVCQRILTNEVMEKQRAKKAAKRSRAA